MGWLVRAVLVVLVVLVVRLAAFLAALFFLGVVATSLSPRAIKLVIVLLTGVARHPSEIPKARGSRIGIVSLLFVGGHFLTLLA